MRIVFQADLEFCCLEIGLHFIVMYIFNINVFMILLYTCVLILDQKRTILTNKVELCIKLNQKPLNNE